MRSKAGGCQLNLPHVRESNLTGTKSPLESDVDRVERFRLTAIFRRRFDGVIIYFFNSDCNFFDDASEFSVTFVYVVFYFLFKVHVNFSSVSFL